MLSRIYLYMSDTTSQCDTLDMTVSCVLNKPYEFYVETNYSNKINGRTGPELVLGLKKLNAWRICRSNCGL